MRDQSVDASYLYMSLLPFLEGEDESTYRGHLYGVSRGMCGYLEVPTSFEYFCSFYYFECVKNLFYFFITKDLIILQESAWLSPWSCMVEDHGRAIEKEGHFYYTTWQLPRWREPWIPRWAYVLQLDCECVQILEQWLMFVVVGTRKFFLHSRREFFILSFVSFWVFRRAHRRAIWLHALSGSWILYFW